MSLTLKTPGVYIEEKNAFSNSVVAVETAIPAFIGYTENATFKGKSLLNKPIRVDSLLEFENFFGMGAHTIYNVATIDPDQEDAPPTDLIMLDKHLSLTPQAGTLFYMYEAVKLFYQNGGASCYVIAIGTYGGGTVKPDFSTDPFIHGLRLLEKEVEPTMVVIPDALLFTDDNGANCYSLQQQMLNHCGTLKSRVAILDVFNGNKGLEDPTYNPIDAFRDAVSSDFLSYGSTYYPWLKTTVVQPTELSYKNLSEDGIVLLKELLTESISGLKEKEIEAMTPYINALTGDIEEGSDVPSDPDTLNHIMNNTFPAYKSVMLAVLEKKNLLPPSGAMAGIFTRVDNEHGVWKAPANVAVNSTIGPAVHIDHNQQQDLNAPILGKAVCAIRPFVGLGTMVWGARTLDANSLDWRYINVRRTMIMIEQSVKFAANAYVFEPNVKNTWVAINSMISSFLTNLWKQGALAGSSPEEAFEVAVGLGSTMSPTDILEGIMNISVKVAISRPAEFIVITFQQQMQKS
ncbi:phage tail sheath family protein [Flavivirga jejuensis]|uniref:Phage tail sheath C-terminal domain-containing protein n=1 Tax=Flavivirga jejuensis TaxID=870487 RepID=A0ABT8WP32_9FLAO|nr:phage tail sheath C-terminal domain-containing protein [Flavivirga jejuensis]MDO5974915.1 phage tail sheath C-terminal domain-containing protein [Flavivirga jejuensis]